MNVRFTQYIPPPDGGDPFRNLLNLFLQLIQYTGGDVYEALQWMNQLDKEYGMTNDEYGMGDFIGKLKKSRPGNHKTTYNGVGDELTTESRPYMFGDSMDHINLTTSLRNAQIN